MSKLQKIFMGLLILAVIFLSVFSQIQRGYAEKEHKKAIVAQMMADKNARKAEAAAQEAAKNAAEASLEKTRAVLIKEQLEACKKRK